MKELMEVLRVQKHDFLNHLQVISGYLQLDKAEKARDYIQQVSHEIYHSGMITKLRLPEVAINLLILKNEAVHYGVNLDISMETELEYAGIAGESLGATVYKMIGIALEQASKSGINSPFCQVKLSPGEVGYIIRTVFPGQEHDLIEKYVALENRTFRKQGGKITFKANSPIEVEIVINIPKG
ncbi:MAG: Spo0B domain-containing protein [Clostridia bacterium]|nr:Spo0B domain-containing protein [Clostridia bacterium]